MGQVTDCCIHYDKADDQFVGRNQCGISNLSTNFTVSACYFDVSVSENQYDKKYFLMYGSVHTW